MTMREARAPIDVSALAGILSLLGLIAIGTAYLRQFLYFRHIDPDWTGLLTLADVITLGWAATPYIAGPLLVLVLPFPVTQAFGRILTRQRPKPHPLEQLALYVPMFLVSGWGIAVALGVTIQMSPDLYLRTTAVAVALCGAVVWTSTLLSHDLRGFLTRTLPACFALLIVIFDMEGYHLRHWPTESRVRFENGQYRCLAVAFVGDRAAFFWDDAFGEAAVVDRGLVAAITTTDDCDDSNRELQPPSSPGPSAANA